MLICTCFYVQQGVQQGNGCRGDRLNPIPLIQGLTDVRPRVDGFWDVLGDPLETTFDDILMFLGDLIFDAFLIDFGAGAGSRGKASLSLENLKNLNIL